MRLEDVLGVGFWVMLVVIAGVSLAYSRRTRQELIARLMRAAVVLPLVVAAAGLIGFAVGGSVGLIGNSIAALLFTAWIGVTWAASGGPLPTARSRDENDGIPRC